jgi:hypothetical protein
VGVACRLGDKAKKKEPIPTTGARLPFALLGGRPNRSFALATKAGAAILAHIIVPSSRMLYVDGSKLGTY